MALLSKPTDTLNEQVRGVDIITRRAPPARKAKMP